MSRAEREIQGQAAAGFNRAASKPTKRTAISPLTLRLTPEERERLEELAAGMTLSAYIRACVFAEETKRRKRRQRRWSCSDSRGLRTGSWKECRKHRVKPPRRRCDPHCVLHVRHVAVELRGEPSFVAVCACRNCRSRTVTAFGVSAYFDEDQVVRTLGEPCVYRGISRKGRWLD